MDKKSWKFLSKLLDGRWHQKNLWCDGVGIRTIEACVEFGLVQRKLIPHGNNKGARAQPIRFIASFKITEKGKKYLKTSEGPPYEYDFTIARSSPFGPRTNNVGIFPVA